MEIITYLLASILGIVSPGGLIIDHIIANRIRERVPDIEQLAVRVDNTPSYQIINGQVDRLRIASRGVQLREDFRLEVLEVETDPLDIDLERLRESQGEDWRKSLNKPLNAGIRLVLSEQDLNQLLQSPRVKQKVEQLFNNFASRIASLSADSYEILAMEVDLLGDNRLLYQMQIQPQVTGDAEAELLNLSVEVGLEMDAGKKLNLVKPVVIFNNIPIPAQFSNGLVRNLSRQLDLDLLADVGILLRVLQLEVGEEQLELAAFVNAEPLSEAATE